MDKEKIMKDAQYRKGLSIGWFNSTNSAIALVASMPDELKLKIDGPEKTKEHIAYWRNWFLEEHKEYYAKVIANVGVAFDVAKTIEKIKSSKTLEELKNNWTSISAEERHNEEVRKVAKELKITLK